MTTRLSIETFPNEAAVAYIKGKAVADPKNFGNLPNQLKQRAFTVAGIEQLDAVKRIRDAVAKLPAGASWDEAKKEIAEVISTYTGVDKKAAKARAEHTLRMQGFQAYAVARHQEQMSTIDVLPYWKYVTVGDNRVRAGHAALDGKVLRADDDWWKTHYPPWDWGCRCIVESLSERQAKREGISEHNDMPTPERSGTFAFDPSDASIDIDQLISTRDEADWRLNFVNPAKNVTIQVDGREPETMWDLMVDLKMQKTAGRLVEQTRRDGKELAFVIDFDTGKQIGKTFVGDAKEVEVGFFDGKNVSMLHTHPGLDNTPSAADFRFGFQSHSKAEYVAAGTRLRRWVWLKKPTREIEKRFDRFDEDNQNGGVDRPSYDAFLSQLIQDGYIKMEQLP